MANDILDGSICNITSASNMYFSGMTDVVELTSGYYDAEHCFLIPILRNIHNELNITLKDEEI